MTQRAEQANLMIPEGRKINLHQVQANADQHQGRTVGGPAQRVVQRLALSNGIKNNVVATQEHLVPRPAAIELRTRSTLYADIAILGIDDVGRAEAGRLLHLERVASQNA